MSMRPIESTSTSVARPKMMRLKFRLSACNTDEESGFDNLPGDRRLEAFRRNEGGWTQQVKNIERYVAQAA